MTLLLAALTGEQALARMKAALVAFEVKGPFRVQALGRTGPMPHPDLWGVTLSTPSGVYEGYLSAEGRLLGVQRGKGSYVPALPKPLAADAIRAARWLKAAGPRFPVRPAARDAWSQRFEAVIAGHPFFEGSYGYAFRWDRAGFTGFQAYERVPPVGPAIPRLGPADALRLATPILRRFDVPGRVEYVRPKVRGLGWLECEGATAARLVYRVVAFPKLLRFDWTKSPNAVSVDIDAVTGVQRKRRVGS